MSLPSGSKRTIWGSAGARGTEDRRKGPVKGKKGDLGGGGEKE